MRYFRCIAFSKIILVSTFILCLISCKENAPKVSIDKDEKTVSYKIISLLSIGVNEADSEIENPNQFAFIAGVACNKDGTIYVLDQKLHCVRVFDKDGKFLKQLFNKGQGPDELSNPVGIVFNDFDNTFFVFNEYGHTIKVFDLNGKFVKKLLPPSQIFHPSQILSEEQLLFIANCIPNENAYSNFKVWNFKKGVMDSEFSHFSYSERSDIFNHKQMFAIYHNVLWTSPINEMAVVAFDLNNGTMVQKIVMPGDFKQNEITDFTYMGYKGIGILAYNFLQPVVLNDEIFVVLTRQEYDFKGKDKLKSMQNPILNRKSIYKILDDNRFEKICVFSEKEEMVIRSTYHNRIIFSLNNPYPHIKVVEVNKE